MRPPEFWQNPAATPGWQARALAPVAALYAAATARRVAQTPGFRAKVPLICVGNLNIGGSGKTPTAIALASRLTARGLAVHIVSRGYGGQMAGPVRVVEGHHSAADVGDEPLLLAAFTPTWVARDRAAGAQAAQVAGAEVILLDDGFQNPALHKDLSIIVVDAAVGFGNGRVLPAGPLREPVTAGLKRGDAVVSIGSDKAQTALGANWPEITTLPRLQAALKPLKMGMDWQGARVLAFAGIGRPEKFFHSLAQEGAEIVASHSFADHAPYSKVALQRLLKEAVQKNAQLVTTEKDAARLPASFRPQVLAFPVRLIFEDDSKLENLLKNAGVRLK